MSVLDRMNLTPEQHAAASHVNGPLLVIAGAGSGKTRVITARVANLIETGVPPHQILAITFTNKAAGEMRERISKLLGGESVLACTFHSFCARLLRLEIRRLGFRDTFTIFDSGDQKSLVKTALGELSLDTTHYPAGMVLGAISRYKNQMIDPERAENEARHYEAKNIARVYQRYQQLLRQNQALDFDDLLGYAAQLLETQEDMLEAWQDRYRYLLVDEYQDTNAAQYRIVQRLAAKYRNLGVTGDPDQSIYSWRGATLRNILDFERDYPDARVIKLEQNFRSTGVILKAADAVIRNNIERKEKTLWTRNPEGAPIDVLTCDSERVEAVEVVRRIRAAADANVPYRDMAVFYRINALSRHVEMALLDAAIPYTVVGGVPFYERAEIKDILAYLRVMANPDDAVSLDRIFNVPARGIGKTTIERVERFAAERGIPLLEAVASAAQVTDLNARARKAVLGFVDMLGRLRRMPLTSARDCIDAVVKETGYEKYLTEQYPDDADRLENVNQLLQAGTEFDSAESGDGLQGFLENVALIADVDTWEAEDDQVTLMTLHAAKGLEFPRVFIIGVDQSMLPHSRAHDDSAEMEEERRLFYVGMTRAMQALTLSVPLIREQWGTTQRTTPSSFLSEIPPAILNPVNLAVGRGLVAPGATTKHYDASDVDDDFADSEEFAYAPQELVRHKIFGLGRVVQTSGFGQSTRVKVRFRNGSVKDFLAAVAKLERCVNEFD